MAMSEGAFYEKIGKIEPLDGAVMAKAKQRQDSLAKPPESLGRLEELSIQMAGITGRMNNRLRRKCIAVFSADNGVWEEGVASAPQSVTRSQTINFLRGYTGVATLSRRFGVELKVVDMGVAEEIPENVYKELGLIDRRIRAGSSNLWKEPAMSREEALKCLETGLEIADLAADEGFDILGIGEMGIGNTTTSSAVLSALTGLGSDKTVGKGGGLMASGLARKKEIVDGVCERHDFHGQGDIDVLDVLSKVGGFDIAAMCGAFLGAALRRLPVVIDGYISAVAALAAFKLNPAAAAYMIPSHRSYEAGYNFAMDAMGLKPFLELGMRLGEGSGCPLAFEIVDAACYVLSEMKTLEEASVDGAYLEELKENMEESFG